MRVMHVIPTLGPGGAERQLALLANEQVNSGSAVLVVINRPSNYEAPNHFFNRNLLSSLVQTREVQDHRRGYVQHITEISDACRQFRPEVIQGWSYTSNVSAAIVGSLCGVPFCFSQRTSIEDLMGVRNTKPFLHHATFTACYLSSAIVANSRHATKGFRERAGLRNKVFFVPNMLGRDAFIERDAECLMQQPSNIIVVGRIIESKRHELVIEAVSDLGNETQIRLIIVGDGDRKQRLEAVVGSKEIRDRISFRGIEINWVRTHGEKSILVSMSDFEGMPNVILEAMAASIPLIVSDIPAHREILTEAEAVFVATGDSDGLSAAIRDCLHDHEGRTERTMSAFRLAQQYLPSLVRTEYYQVYRMMLAK